MERTPEHSSTQDIPGGSRPSNPQSSQIKLNLRQKDSEPNQHNDGARKKSENPRNTSIGDVKGVRRRLETSSEGTGGQCSERIAEKTVDRTVAKRKSVSKTPSPNTCGNIGERRSPSKCERRKKKSVSGNSSDRSTPVNSGRQTPRSNASSRGVTPRKGVFDPESEVGAVYLQLLNEELCLLNDKSGHLNTSIERPSDQRARKGRDSSKNTNSVSNATDQNAFDIDGLNQSDDLDVTLRADDVTTDDDDQWEDVSEPGEQGLKIVEADPELDSRLDEMADKHKMSAANVKSMIHHILTDADVVSLMESKMNKLGEEATDSAGPGYQPKLTRAKLKEITEGKTPQPWSLAPWPLSPVKPKVKQKVTLMDLQFSEVEDDEYDPSKAPEQELSEDDSESIVSSSRTSDIGSPMPSSPMTPCTPTTPCTPIAPLMYAGTDTTPKLGYLDQAPGVSPMGPPRQPQPKQKSLFKKRLIIEEAPETIARRTRSKLPLVDTPLDVIESSFVAPDFTPEMYDLEYDLDDDYLNFLKTLVKSDQTQTGSEAVDDENDPEYNFLAEEEVDDRDEMRHDKSVKVTKKELNELLDGVFDIFGPDADDDLPPLSDYAEPCVSSKVMSILEQAATECDVPRDFTESIESIEQNNACALDEPLGAAVVEVDQVVLEPLQRQQLDDQMRKHCQLLMQLWVLAEEPSGPQSRLRWQCDAYLNELDILRENSPCGENSAFNAHNLDSALTLLGTFGGYPVIPELAKWRTKLRIGQGDHSARYLRPDQMHWFYHWPGLLYPKLLPVCNFKTAAQLQSMNIMIKTTFCQAEDNLMALGLSQMPKGMRSIDKYQKLVQYLLPAKLASQIQKRISFLKKGGPKENSVQYLAKHGVLPKMDRDISPFNPDTLACPKDLPKNELPHWCENLEIRLAMAARRVSMDIRSIKVRRLKAEAAMMKDVAEVPDPDTGVFSPAPMMAQESEAQLAIRAKPAKKIVRAEKKSKAKVNPTTEVIEPRDPKNIRRDEMTVLELLKRKRCVDQLLGGTDEVMARVSAACQALPAHTEILAYPAVGGTGPKRKLPDDDEQNDDDPNCSSSTLVGDDETAVLKSPERKSKRRKKSDDKEEPPSVGEPEPPSVGEPEPPSVGEPEPPSVGEPEAPSAVVVPTPAVEDTVLADQPKVQGKGRIMPRLSVTLPVITAAKRTRVGKGKRKAGKVPVEVELSPSTSQTTLGEGTAAGQITLEGEIATSQTTLLAELATSQTTLLAELAASQTTLEGEIATSQTTLEEEIGLTDNISEQCADYPVSISQAVFDTFMGQAVPESVTPERCRVKTPLPEPDSPGDADVTCADDVTRADDVSCADDVTCADDVSRDRDSPHPSCDVEPIEFQVLSMAGDDCSVSVDYGQAVRLLHQPEPTTDIGGRTPCTDEVTSSGERTTPGRDSQSIFSPGSVVTPRTVHTSPDSSTSPIYTVTHNDNLPNLYHSDSDNDNTGAFSCLQEPSTTPPLSPPPLAEPEPVSSTSTHNCSKTPDKTPSSSRDKPSPSPRKERAILPKTLIFELHVSPTKRAADKIRNRRKKQIRQSPQRLRPILPRRPKTKSVGLENAKEIQEPSVEHVEEEVEECIDEEEEQMNEVEKEKEDDHDHLAQLMAASTTISVAPKKKGNLTKHEKIEKKKQLYDTITRPDILESDPLSEERVMACTIDYLERVRKALETDPDRLEQFSKALVNMEDSTMEITELYEEVRTTLRDHPQLVVDFALFLTPEQAVECGCHSEYEKFQKGKLFMRKLELYFQKMPSQLHRLRKALSADQSHEDIYNAVKNLLRNQPLLLDEFSQFIEDETPPESHMTDFEEVYLLDDSGESEKSQPPGQSSDPESCERLYLPEDEDNFGTKECGCPCHDSSKGAWMNRKTHCRKCALKVKDNRLYYVGQRRGSQQAVTVVRHDRTTGKPIMPVKQKIERKTAGRRVRQHSTDSLKLSDAELRGKKRTKKLKRPRSTSKQPLAPECTTPEPPSVSDNENDSMTEASADDNSDMDTPHKENGRREGQVRPGEFESEEEMEISGEMEDAAARTDDDSDDHHSDVARCRGNQSDGASCHGSEPPPDDEASRDSVASGQTASSWTQRTSESDCEVVNDSDLDEACVPVETVAMGTQSITVAGNEDEAAYVSTTPPLPPPDDDDEAAGTLSSDVQSPWSMEEDKFILESFRGVDDVSADVFYRIAQQMNCRTAELVESRFNTLMEMMAEMGDSASDVSESSDVENG